MRDFSTVLISFGLNPSRIVIELPAAAVAHRTFLGYLTKSYQHYGFKVAANLPNAGQILSVSDMARPDFVKMDAGAALRDAMVKPLVGYANRLRIPLIFNRVTTEAQFDMLVVDKQVTATAASDHTVRVLVTGLAAATDYYYRFTDASGSGSRWTSRSMRSIRRRGIGRRARGMLRSRRRCAIAAILPLESANFAGISRPTTGLPLRRSVQSFSVRRGSTTSKASPLSSLPVR